MTMWNTFSVCLSRAAESATEASLLHTIMFNMLLSFGEFWPKNQFFLNFSECSWHYARLICKVLRSQYFFSCLKKYIFYLKLCFSFFLIPMSRIICISFYNIDWYIIYSIILKSNFEKHFFYLIFFKFWYFISKLNAPSNLGGLKSRPDCVVFHLVWSIRLNKKNLDMYFIFVLWTLYLFIYNREIVQNK